jgi:antitoxin component of MazEF toxin-antitoxin module
MPIAKIRKSGNSTVLVVSPEIIKERKIKVGETVEYQIFKNVNLKRLLGRGKHLKLDAQKAKDELREEW